MTPEAYIAPFAAPLALGLLSLALACLVWLVITPRAPGPSRQLLHTAATGTSIAALLWVPIVFFGVWSGSGPLWLLVSDSRVNETLVENLIVWTPIALLVLSVVLASVSGRRRDHLLPWAVVTVPGLLVMLYVVAVMGLAISPS